GGLDLLEMVHDPEQGVADDRDALRAREPLVDREELLPDLEFLGVRDGGVVDDYEPALGDVPQGSNGPLVPQTHVGRGHPGADFPPRLFPYVSHRVSSVSAARVAAAAPSV